MAQEEPNIPRRPSERNRILQDLLETLSRQHRPKPHQGRRRTYAQAAINGGPPPKHSGSTTQGNHISTPARYEAVSEEPSHRAFFRVDRNHPDRAMPRQQASLPF
ncbi:uncharacterized protein CTHT_0038940 [Thermochaetoides thermophila DSM 1495]|uniref:Uncharacterized protein n=1 Tax=Chaetomium thermophilum (strain DSM 1495 / CBS 144.50 / IMI 039719) TaxID=759272 RepID=G0S3U7_CHATD|nr:hypothetical protein CTHT_0038940 [Thermochaetoides thermophila DSM 1495]EGS22009.1 hypothetical protein CTHT_0038940 [Thermochaetoides thermophila DSM 1495]